MMKKTCNPGYKPVFVICLMIVFFTNTENKTIAQTNNLLNDIEIITKRTMPPVEPVNHPQAELKLQINPMKTILNTFVFLYQSVISDQIQPYCIFYPSCSRFGHECLAKTNAIHALLLTCDRLMRCNTMNRKYYQNYPKKGRNIYDPVQKYLH